MLIKKCMTNFRIENNGAFHFKTFFTLIPIFPHEQMKNDIKRIKVKNWNPKMKFALNL